MDQIRYGNGMGLSQISYVEERALSEGWLPGGGLDSPDMRDADFGDPQVDGTDEQLEMYCRAQEMARGIAVPAMAETVSPLAGARQTAIDAEAAEFSAEPAYS